MTSALDGASLDAFGAWPPTTEELEGARSMISWKSALFLVPALAPASPSPIEQIECRTYVCGGAPTCVADSRCRLGCDLVLVSTPYGIGATCVCKDDGSDRCCDIVLIPGGDGGTMVHPVGECGGFNLPQDRLCELGDDCQLYRDYFSGWEEPSCFPPPPYPGD